MYFKKWLIGLFVVLLMIFIASCGSKEKKSVSKTEKKQPITPIQKPSMTKTEKEILFIVKEKQSPTGTYSDELNLSFQEIKTDGTGMSEIPCPVGFRGNCSHKNIKDSKLKSSTTSYSSWKTVEESNGIVTVGSFQTGESHNLNWKPDEFSDAPKFKNPIISPDGSKVIMYSEKDNTLYLTDADGDGKDLKKVLSKTKGKMAKEGTIDAHPLILDIEVLWLADSSKFISYELLVHYLERIPGGIVGKEIIEGHKFYVFDNSGNELNSNTISVPNSDFWVKEKYPDSSGYLCILSKRTKEGYTSWHEIEYVKLTAEGKIETLNLTINIEDLKIETLSPDCSKIILSDNQNIWTVGLDGSEPVNLTDTKEDRKNYTPLWSPDGKKIAFASDVKDEKGYSTKTEIWIMDADGGNKEKLASEVPNFILLAWGKIKVEN